MTNHLIHVRFTLDVTEEKLAALMGRPDDGTDGWHEESYGKAIQYVEDNLMDAIDQYGQVYEPEVEA
jgi:hypothetical protein